MKTSASAVIEKHPIALVSKSEAEAFAREERRETDLLEKAASNKTAVRLFERKRRQLIIERVGREVLDSKLFEKARTQIHHYNNTVAGHTMEVSEVGLHIAELLEKHGIRVNKEEVIRITLLHDFGIIGRHEKFKNNFVTNFQHPKDSVQEALKIYPDLSKKEQKNIARHMFPSTFMFPTNREGWILIAADKIASLHDVQRRFFHKKNHMMEEQHA
ncbi:MAG: HD domain-containing protein [Lachnospiraceae bacterium]|nr:HD domain-containing protein [Lachnospiraceae bacterium]